MNTRPAGHEPVLDPSPIVPGKAQARGVQVVNFVAEGTIEESMLSTRAFKKSLFVCASAALAPFVLMSDYLGS